MTREPSPLALVIGFGNCLRGDDAFGRRVAERLEEVLDGEQVIVISRHALVPELAADLARVRLAVFVDAAATGAPGELICRTVLAGSDPPEVCPHAFQPADLLSLSRALYGCAPLSYYVGVRGESFALDGGQLTPRVEAAVQLAVESIGRVVHGARGGGVAVGDGSEAPADVARYLSLKSKACNG